MPKLTRAVLRLDPDADETNCEKCDTTIEIADEESIAAAVVDHYQAQHDL